MEIGLNIGDGLYVTIGQTFDSIMKYLGENSIDYNIPFDNSSLDNSKKAVVLYIDKCGAELNIEENKVVYIKSMNYDENMILTLDEISDNKVNVLNSILKEVMSKYAINRSDIRIDSYDTSNLNTVLTLKDSIRISLICNGHNIHIHTVRRV